MAQTKKVEPRWRAQAGATRSIKVGVPAKRREHPSFTVTDDFPLEFNLTRSAKRTSFGTFFAIAARDEQLDRSATHPVALFV